VFAAGDVRLGSVKRVGSAIGEGAQVVAELHAYLAAEADTSRLDAVETRHRRCRCSLGGSTRRIPSLPLPRGRAGAADEGHVEGVGVVRHQHEERMAVLDPPIIDEVNLWQCRAPAEHLVGRLEQRAQLRVSIGRKLDRVAVDSQRHVVEEEPLIHLGHVDEAFDPPR
jgi:hypothetical protein